MTIAKTKAETAIGEQFAQVADKLPGSPAVSEARKAAIGAFETLGLPHRRIEEWKYTDLRSAVTDAFAPAVGGGVTVSAKDVTAALGSLATIEGPRAVFVDGAFDAGLSDVGGVDGLKVEPLSARIDGLERMSVSDSDALIALNTAFMTDGAVVTVADGAELARPLMLVFLRARGEAEAVATRNIISIGKNAKVTLLEADVALAGAGDGQRNALSEINVGDGAEVAHIKCTREGKASTHLSTWIAEIGADAIYNAFQMTAATRLARNNLFVTFNGEGSKLDISGAFLGRDNHHIDTTLVVDHAVPHCESRELFKGVLDDNAKGVFQGKVIVQPDAQKTDGKQMAQVLMLSDTCEFDSKPELEIYADDVVCGHGSTSAQLDDELMFYCRARGIPEDEARALIIESFIGEALEQVENESIREALQDIARAWLV